MQSNIPQDQTANCQSPRYQDVNGFLLPMPFSPDKFRSALSYKPVPDDVFIVSFPKCGSTWVQNIVASIYNQGKEFGSCDDIQQRCSFLELSGADGPVQMKRPGAIKTHLPFHLVPYSPDAKYVVITRNPKDCCVSFYYHAKNHPSHEFSEGTFDDFFELFIAGKTCYGDYFDTLMSWYKHKDDQNVLFLTYENLKDDIKQQILNLVKFLGSPYQELLISDADILSSVAYNSSFDVMKKLYSKDGRADGNRAKHEAPSTLSTQKRRPFEIVRKGIIGDWRNHFSETQNRRLRSKFLEKTKGTDLPDLWRNCM